MAHARPYLRSYRPRGLRLRGSPVRDALFHGFRARASPPREPRLRESRLRGFLPQGLQPRGALLLAAALQTLPHPTGIARAEAAELCPTNLEQGDACAAAGYGDPGTAPGGAVPATGVGNPISLVTGNKTQREIDFSLPDAPLAFRRHYASAATDVDIGLGHGWRHSYAVLLSAGADGTRRIVDATGRHVRFDPAGLEPERVRARTRPEGHGSALAGVGGSAGADANGASGATLGADVSAKTRRHRLYRARNASDGHLVETDDATTWHVPDGRRLRFHGSWLVRIDWPDARHLALRYAQRRLASVSDESGRRIALEWTPGNAGLPGFDPRAFTSQPGHLAAIVLPDGERVAFDYDERRNLTRARYADGTARRYHYEDARWPNALSGLTDRRGVRFASWRYDDAGRAVGSERSDGVERVTLEIEPPEDTGGRVGDVGRTVVTDAEGRRSLYLWRRHPGSGAALLLSSEGPGCASCPPTGRRHAYTEDGRLESTARLDADGREIARRRFEHDVHGRLVRTVDTLYDEHGNAIERLVERREYGGGGASVDDDPPSRPDTFGARSGTDARPDAGTGSGTDPLPGDPRFWRPTTVALPSVNEAGERRLEIVYDPDGLPRSMTEHGFAPVFAATVATRGDAATDDPLAWRPIRRRTRLRHEAGRLVAIDGPRDDVDDVTRLDWDDAGRLVAVHPPAAPPVRITAFDGAGRPAEIRVGERAPFTLRRDARGDVVEIRHGANALRYRHDAEGRPLSITDSDGRGVTLSHDAAGRLASVGDDLGRVTTLVHDAESRLVARTLTGTDGTTVRSIEQLLDAHGRLAGSRERRAGSPSGEVLEHELTVTEDAAGRRVALGDASGGTLLAADLDLVGRALAVTRGGATSTIAFDALGQDIAFGDARGNRTRLPKDDFGRTVLVDGPDTGRVHRVHDAAGNLVESRDGDGRVVRFTHDAANRMTSRTDADGTTRWVWNERDGTLVEAINDVTTERFAYDTESRLVRHEREIDGHRFTTRYAYDDRGRVTAKYLPDGQTLGYHYHESGPNRGTLRTITRERLLGLSRETLLGEIDLETRDGQSGYLSHNGLRYRRTHAPDGRVVRVETDKALRLDYTFDAAADGGLRFTGDAAGRTVAVHRGAALVARYAYNAFGERVRKVVHATGKTPRITYFLHDGDTLSAEIDDSGAVRAQYVYLEDFRPVVMLAGRAAYAIHGDHLGTPRQMSDAAGEVVWRAEHAPFGRALVTRAEIDLPLRLPGQYHDAESGLHHNRFRDYDPSSGRYRSPDPLGLGGGANLYLYADADPLDTADPLGLYATDLLSGGARPRVALKPRAGERLATDARRFGYFALWVGQQYVGYARGFLDAAGETVLFATDVLRYSADHSPIAMGADLVYENPPAWLPSYQRGRRTTEGLIEIGRLVADDPSLIWEAISDPYVSAWAECRYGEALGRGAFEVGTALLPAGLAARLAALSRAGRLTTLADVLTTLRLGEALAPDEYAVALRRLADEARANGTMDELVAAARHSDTLDDLIVKTPFTGDEIWRANDIPGTRGTVADANFAQPVIRTDEAFSDGGRRNYTRLAGRSIVTVDDLVEAIRDGTIRIDQVKIDYVDRDGTRLILNTRTSVALQRAGVSRSEWYGVDRSGTIAYLDKGEPVIFDTLAEWQLGRNRRRQIPGQIGWPELQTD